MAKSSKEVSAKKQYIEIINWKKAQPKMKGANNPWMKLYTSLLDNEAFARLDNDSRILLIGLWLYAARSGRSVFPADPAWLFRRILFLHSLPDLTPLLGAGDGTTPGSAFIRYCEPQAPEKGKKKKDENKKAAKKKTEAVKKPAKKKNVKKTKNGTAVATHAHGRAQREESRLEESRQEETRVYNTDLNGKDSARINTDLNGLGKREQSRAKQSTAEQSTAEHSTAEQSRAQQTTAQQDTQGPQQATEPVNPKESEAGAAEGRYVPTRPRSAYRGGGTVRMADILAGMYPEHWRDGDCEQFGWDIVGALGYSTTRTNMHSRSEWGSFASWLSRLKSVTTAVIADELKVIGITKAVFLNTAKARSARNKSSVWFKIMSNELESRGIRLPDIRASTAL